MKQFFSEALIFILLIAAVFLWQKSTLSAYTVPLLGLLTFIYLVSTFKRSKQIKALPVFLLTVSSLLLILSTGGIYSALFFLLYFLSFTIAFVLQPQTVFTFNLILFLFFLPESLQGDSLINLTKISSLLLLSPLAYFFGKEIQSREKKEKQVKETVKRIQSDIAEVVKTDGANLKEQEVKELADAISQTRELEKETTK
jgi:hypothetical protein